MTIHRYPARAKGFLVQLPGYLGRDDLIEHGTRFNAPQP